MGQRMEALKLIITEKVLLKRLEMLKTAQFG